ncbi:MAG: hypothetical protein KC729_13135, partial [Candidatus Eisenbacteria bacterium]|nr:hypothetical protein [Candidatus Eisenbacteria bacterium]
MNSSSASARTRHLPILLGLLATVISLVAENARAGLDPAQPSVVAIESWYQEMAQYYAAHPELRDQRGSGWMPYSRAKWFTDQRREDGRLPDPLDLWRAWEAKRAIESRLAGRAVDAANPVPAPWSEWTWDPSRPSGGAGFRADDEAGGGTHGMSGTGWFQLGPTNMSGRIISIAVHPQDPSIVYVGGAGGGLWKTTDAGDTWIPLTDFLPDLAIGGIALLPSDPDVVLIGTGEGTGTTAQLFGVGLFKSSDAGMSWAP